MSIRYFVDLPCQPREDLGPDELLQLVLLRERAAQLRSRFAEKGITDPAAMRFRERVTTPDGETTRERSVGDLMAETAVLDNQASWCRSCPAAVIPSAFGCIWQVSLPISNAAQCWLLEQLPGDGSRGLDLFRSAVEALGYDRPGVLNRWREAGFVEGATPPVIERDGFTPNADMILTELFLVGDLMPTHTLGILLHLQALKAADGRVGDDLITLIETMTSTESAEDAPGIEFALAPSEEDDRSTREVKHFLAACYLGLELQVPIAIRL